MKEFDLAEAFSKVRDGDKEAFVCIYNELKQPVFTIAKRIVRSESAAEDITQDAFVKLYISPPDPSVKNLRAWVFQMARNLSIDVLRKKQCADIDELQISTDDELDSIVTRLDVESAIGRLSCIEREIVTLRLNGELRFGEIARIVGLPMSAVYRKYRKALNSLRHLLDGGAL